jgi:hypothetical protein
MSLYQFFSTQLALSIVSFSTVYFKFNSLTEFKENSKKEQLKCIISTFNTRASQVSIAIVSLTGRHSGPLDSECEWELEKEKVQNSVMNEDTMHRKYHSSHPKGRY